MGIKGNEFADFTAKKAMNDGIKDNTKPAKSEIYSVINKAIMKKWQQQWDPPPPLVNIRVDTTIIFSVRLRKMSQCTALIDYMTKSTRDSGLDIADLVFIALGKKKGFVANVMINHSKLTITFSLNAQHMQTTGEIWNLLCLN